MRKHRNGTVRKVDAGAAQARFEIEVGRGTDIFGGNIGDVDLQLPTAVVEFC